MYLGLAQRVRVLGAILITGCLVQAAPMSADAASTKRFRTGAVPESKDAYAKHPHVPLYRGFVVDQVDLSSRFPTPGFQGEQSSCVAWALAYAVRSYHDGWKHGWRFDSEDKVFSPAYIYNRLSGDRQCDTGLVVASGLELLRDEGVTSLARFPYKLDDCTSSPDAAVQAAAADNRIRAWRVIEAGRLDTIKAELAKGNPVIFVLRLADSFLDFEGDGVYNDLVSPRADNHAMVFVGYDEKRQAFRVINSWGLDWGDQGFGWISYEVVRRDAEQMYVVEPTVPPKPAPRPPPIVVAHGPEAIAPKPLAVDIPAPAPAPSVTVIPRPPLIAPAPAVTPQIVPVSQPLPPPAPPPSVIIAPQPVAPRPGDDPPKPTIVIAPQPAAPVIEPAVPPLALIQSAVAEQLREAHCGRLTATATNDRVVTLKGFIGSADALSGIHKAIMAIPGVRDVRQDVAVQPWPQCEVYLTFQDVLATPRGLKLNVPGVRSGTLSEGDLLTIEVTSPDFPSYLYVSYLQASGEAVHLVWPQGSSPRPVPPKTKLVFGDPARSDVRFRVAPPFGDEILVAVASPVPLFRGYRPEVDGDRDYLTTFRKAFLTEIARSRQKVAGAAVPLVTRSKDAGER